MPVTSELKGNELSIKLPEEFNFHCQSDFRQAYENTIENRIKRIVVDFRATRYMDSSSLGMLLILREYVGQYNINQEDKIELINCSKEVLDILGVTNFEKLFVIK